MHVGPGPEPCLGVAQVSRVHFRWNRRDHPAGCEENGAFAPVCAGFDHCIKGTNARFNSSKAVKRARGPVQRARPNPVAA